MLTLSKIAKLANVSVSTASKAFSGSPEVNEDTREMVFDIARKNGCFKKFYNAKFPKLVIAIIAPEFKSAYYTRYLSCIQNLLAKENCELCVSTTDFSPEREKSLLEYYYKHSAVDGIIRIYGKTALDGKYEIPVVSIDTQNSITSADAFRRDMKPGLAACARYLKEKNVTSIGFVGESLTQGKRQFFAQCLEEVGLKLKEEYVSMTQHRFEEGGYAAMEALFARGCVPRALLCAYDNMAIGAIRCICDRGLRVPEDVAVLGMDDIPGAAYLNPPLASISSQTEQLCRMAVAAVLDVINGKEAERQTAGGTFHLRRSFEL